MALITSLSECNPTRVMTVARMLVGIGTILSATHEAKMSVHQLLAIVLACLMPIFLF